MTSYPIRAMMDGPAMMEREVRNEYREAEGEPTADIPCVEVLQEADVQAGPVRPLQVDHVAAALLGADDVCDAPGLDAVLDDIAQDLASAA